MIQNELSRHIATALKAKAPIVAIPVEGHAPVCVRRKLLAGALKGVSVRKVDLIRLPDEVKYDRPKCDWITQRLVRTSELMNAGAWFPDVPQGPEREIRTHGGFALEVKGVVTCKHTLPIRTRCRFTPIPRREAVKELSKWSDAERKRLEKKIGQGAIGTYKNAVKRLALGEAGDDMVETRIRNTNGTIEKVKGIHITLPALPELTFVLHPKFDHDGAVNHWAVTETSTGQRAGDWAKTPEEAVSGAIKASNAMKPEARAKLVEKIKTMALPEAA